MHFFKRREKCKVDENLEGPFIYATSIEMQN